jgi:hypothetical protein
MKFDRKQFEYSGGYLTYGPDRKFVARFKRGGKAGFVSFLVKHFTVSEYFDMLNTVNPAAAAVGNPREYAPAEVLETKGYVCDNVKRILKRAGYPLTWAGFDAYLADQAKARAFNAGSDQLLGRR